MELSNGMVIFLQEDHELPLVGGYARIRGGSVSEPAEKVGLVDIYGDVWRTGGTKTQTGDQLDDFLEVRAAKVETGPGPDSTSISFSCLKGDLDDVFKAFVDVLQNPEFRPEKIEIAQKGEADSISRRNDDVGEISHRESVKLAYGPDNPYASVPEYATVDGRHPARLDRLAQEIRSSEQHDPWYQRGFRLRGHGIAATCRLRFLAKGYRPQNLR